MGNPTRIIIDRVVTGLDTVPGFDLIIRLDFPISTNRASFLGGPGEQLNERPFPGPQQAIWELRDKRQLAMYACS